jgi:hypothetical protein
MIWANKFNLQSAAWIMLTKKNEKKEEEISLKLWLFETFDFKFYLQKALRASPNYSPDWQIRFMFQVARILS